MLVLKSTPAWFLLPPPTRLGDHASGYEVHVSVSNVGLERRVGAVEASRLGLSNKVSASSLPGSSELLGIIRITNHNNKQWRRHSRGFLRGSAHLIIA